MGEAGKEAVVKVTHAKRSLHVQLGRGQRELLDGGGLLLEGADPPGVHFVTQKGHRGLSDDTLVKGSPSGGCLVCG